MMESQPKSMIQKQNRLNQISNQWFTTTLILPDNSTLHWYFKKYKIVLLSCMMQEN